MFASHSSASESYDPNQRLETDSVFDGLSFPSPIAFDYEGRSKPLLRELFLLASREKRLVLLALNHYT